MKIYVCLTIFALQDKDAFILLKNDNIILKEMIDDSPNSYTIIEETIYESMGITGRWEEARAKLVGILDEVDRRDPDTNERMIIIVYAMYLPCVNSVKDGYYWDRLENIEKSNIISEEYKNIIRYSATYV